jgi:hypothetical protein
LSRWVTWPSSSAGTGPSRPTSDPSADLRAKAR